MSQAMNHNEPLNKFDLLRYVVDYEFGEDLPNTSSENNSRFGNPPETMHNPIPPIRSTLSNPEPLQKRKVPAARRQIASNSRSSSSRRTREPKVCFECGTSTTPKWRRGSRVVNGRRIRVCNACGIRDRRNPSKRAKNKSVETGKNVEKSPVTDSAAPPSNSEAEHSPPTGALTASSTPMRGSQGRNHFLTPFIGHYLPARVNSPSQQFAQFPQIGIPPRRSHSHDSSPPPRLPPIQSMSKPSETTSIFRRLPELHQPPQNHIHPSPIPFKRQSSAPSTINHGTINHTTHPVYFSQRPHFSKSYNVQQKYEQK